MNGDDTITSGLEGAWTTTPTERIQKEFNKGAKYVSLADLIVLAGCAGIESAAKKAGHNVKVPFSAGRNDALQEQTDVESFAVLEPIADGFRNYFKRGTAISMQKVVVRK